MKEKFTKLILFSFLVFFLVLLFAEHFGYYETKEQRVKTLTEEQIKIFENDIKEGKQIDITDYVLEENKDYTNNLSSSIYKISLILEKKTDELIKIIFNKAGNLVND